MSFIDEIKCCLNIDGLRFVVFGKKGAYFEGVSSILTLDESCIELKTKDGIIKIEGTMLQIKKYCQADVAVLGKISKLELK